MPSERRTVAASIRNRRHSILAIALLFAIVFGIGWHVWQVGSEWTEPKAESSSMPCTAIFDVPANDTVNVEPTANIIRAVFLVPEYLPPVDERLP